MDLCLSLLWFGRHSVTEYLFCFYTVLLMFPSSSIACPVTDFILWTRIAVVRTEYDYDWTTIY